MTPTITPDPRLEDVPVLRDRIVAYIRTVVPVIVGSALGWLIGRFTPVADTIAWADRMLDESGNGGVSVLLALQTAVTALVIVGYYALGRALGARWPQLERILLGSAKRPVYAPAGAPAVLTYPARRTPLPAERIDRRPEIILEHEGEIELGFGDHGRHAKEDDAPRHAARADDELSG